MDFFDVLANRHSVRSFESEPIKDEQLEKILEAANSAPSAGNLQAYDIVLVTKQDAKDALSSAAFGQSFISEAQVVLVFLANPKRSSSRYGARGAALYSIQDATIACAYAQLAAAALGLGSVWVGAFEPEAVKKAVGASDSLPVAILPIGKPAEKPYESSRRKISDLAHENHFK